MMNPAEPDQPAASDFEATTIPWLADVRRFALRLSGCWADADDLTQTTYLNALRGWHTYRHDDQARRWLMTICRHAYCGAHRSQGRLLPVEDPELESLMAAMSAQQGAAALSALEQRDLGAAIDEEIAKLSEAYRSVVVLVDVEGMAYDEAAGALGVPIGTIRSRLYRGRRLLQEALIVRAEDAGLLSGVGAHAH